MTRALAYLVALFVFGVSPALAQFSDQATYVVGGGTNAQTASFPNATSLADVLGVPLRIQAGGSNTGAATLNVNGLGAQSILKTSPGGPVALTGSPAEIVSGQIYSVVWDGTNFQLISAVSNAATPQGCQLNGLKIVNNASPNSQMNVSFTSAILVDPTTDIGTHVGSSGTLTVNITNGNMTSAAGGMDGSAPTANGFIKLWVVYNGTTLAVTGSNATNATVNRPATYIYACYAGSAKVNGSSNFYGFQQYGDEANYVNGGNNVSGLPVITNGVQGSTCGTTTPTYGSFVVQGNSGAAPLWFPPTATAVDVLLNQGFTSADSAVVLVAPTSGTVYGGIPASNSNTNPPPLGLVTYSGAGQFGRIKLESSALGICISTASGAVHAYGWRDSVNAN
jgi:hypothetical protein